MVLNKPKGYPKWVFDRGKIGGSSFSLSSFWNKEDAANQFSIGYSHIPIFL
jgi:hypothetical protein